MRSGQGATKAFGTVWLAAAGLMAAAISGCGSEPTGPGGGPPPMAIASVVVAPGAETVTVGAAVQLVAVARSANGDTVRTATFSWSSENPTVATVSATGLVSTLRAGRVKVTATAGTRSGFATIDVEDPAPAPTILALSPASAAAGGPDLILTITGTGFRPDVRLQWNGTARPTEYVSPTVARASVWAGDLAAVGTAVVQLVNPGSGGATATVDFPIVPQTNPVASVELSRALAYTTTGGAVPMTATVRDGAGHVLAGRLVTWGSGNQLVATVNGAGLVQPTGVGEVTITATSEGRSATLALTVGTKATHLVLDDGVVGLSTFDMRLGTVPVLFWQSALGTRSGEPSLSPDGRWIAYTIEMGTVNAVAVLDQAARTYLFLTNVAASDQAAWSPAGGRIAFRGTGGGRSDVWTVNPDGTGAVNLTATMPQGWQAGWPAWSPDGSRIVFSAGPVSDRLGLYTMRPDGTGIQPLLISTHRDTDASWHGNAVVFTRQTPDGATNLFRIPVGGGPLIQLTQSGQASMPAWSPDGRWIAFADGPAVSGRYDIKAVRPFGEEVRPLSLRSTGGGGRNPTWLSHQ